MPSAPPARKSIQHFNIEGHAHLLTFSCVGRRPLLLNDDIRTLFSRSIDRAGSLHSFGLISFVYMPEHVHLLVSSKAATSKVEKLLYAIKKPFSDKTKLYLTAHNPSLVKALTIQERPGKITFRFWQEGPGHDRNLLSIKNCIHAADYLHHNPVRRQLCASPDLWRWSSWKHYHVPGFHDAALPRIDGFPA
jgi:putative transposase